MPPRRSGPHIALQLPCEHPGCNRWFKTHGGRTKHRLAAHPTITRPSRNPSPPSNPPLRPPPSPGTFQPGNQDEDNFDEQQDNSDEQQEGELRMGGTLRRVSHPYLNGQPCDAQGHSLPPNAQPPPLHTASDDDWTPYADRTQFEAADLLYRRAEMSARQIDALMDIWAATLLESDLQRKTRMPPFANAKHLYDTIDNTPLAGTKWSTFSIKYSGNQPSPNRLPWMDQTFNVWFRDPLVCLHNMLANPDFKDSFDYAPYQEHCVDNNERQYQDFMSGDWAWLHADKIAEDPTTHGSTFIPVVLGSDKTTVSVATGNNEYYPLYMSIGNVHNTVRRGHQNAVAVIGFLAIPKTTKEHSSNEEFRLFRRQLFHNSLSTILQTLKPVMTTPEIVRYGDGHLRKTIYGLGPYIADYEEQALLACIVRGWCARCTATRRTLDSDPDTLNRCQRLTETLFQYATLDQMWHEFGIVGNLVPFTNDFPRADIHELIAPDLLHQLIKGCFKDHLVDWVEKFITQTSGSTRQAERIMDDIDRRIAAVAPFAGLRRFPQGRGFKQWTGDDSKALMKVYIAAIEGYVPDDVVRTFRAFTEFCYLVRRNVITDSMLSSINDAIQRFHRYREVFKRTGIVSTFSLPRQHSMKHYAELIRLFGAPNGLCSSITENKHITAVKKPYRRSNKYKALGQILVTNQRLDKLLAARTNFTSRGMLNGTCLSSALSLIGKYSLSVASYLTADFMTTEAQIQSQHQLKRARTVRALAIELAIPDLMILLRRFLFECMNPNDARDITTVPDFELPCYDGAVSVVNSASSRFYAPSDLSGAGGMHKEYIRSCPIWRGEGPRYDCVFVGTDPDADGMYGYEIARVYCFFSFIYKGITYPCAVIRWYDKVGEEPDELTGMWIVRPATLPNHKPNYAIIHIDSIYRAAHLIPVYGTRPIPLEIKPHHSYDAFNSFYVNKYADHHSFEIAS
ncbi:hypothetical protein L210DRAFT_3614552 [Boletus edulis BED1]|uniref:C2H2-type domain-containing protein n=1 Tax=Boletus edulis BED1 TaxID=1328754 RepID=A0AAD4G9B4_BOLED|nr:hypothetical protein L210DRAFT_3614552 [Boletus edulis BED1]